MINRAIVRGKRLDKDCMRANTSSHEYGADDDRIFCFGLYDKSSEELLEKCENCKALAGNSEPLKKYKEVVK